MRYLKWGTPTLASALFALSACGGSMSTTPAGLSPSISSSVAYSPQVKRLTIVAAHPNKVTCDPNLFPGGCYSFSQSDGLVIYWCYGPPSAPCSDTSEITNWHGNVIRVKNGNLVKQIKVTWSGPFPCGPSTCGTGTYEEDSMVSGRKPPPRSKKYVYEQVAFGCFASGCTNLTTFGINVIP